MSAVSSHVDEKHWAAVAEALNPPSQLVPVSAERAAEWERLMESCGHISPDAKDTALARQLRQDHGRKARSDFRSGQGISPYPVYVAHFADGTQQRLSFWTRAGKPIDFAAGFNVSMIIGRAVPIGGHVECGSQVIPDPFFGQAPALVAPRKESAAARLKAICKALQEGEIEAAILMAKAA